MKYLFLFFAIYLSLLSAISIYDIQFTINPGEGTYPSPYEGQVVITGGIVSGIDFYNGRFFICSSYSGPWNGIYVYDNDQILSVGDSIVVEAEVYEYYGFTELVDLEYCNLISSGNQIPSALNISTEDVDSQEEFESTLVEISDIIVTQNYDEYDEWKVSDGGESCFIGIGFFNLEELGFPLVMDYPFSSIEGIVSFEWGEFKLNPLSLQNFRSAPESYVISIQEQYNLSTQEFEIPIQLSFLGELQQAQSYQFVLSYDESILGYSGYNLAGTLSSGGTIQVEQLATGLISASFTGNFSFSQIQILIKLSFTSLESGTTILDFPSFSIDNIEIDYFSLEQIFSLLDTTPVGDTLTIIQKPILNIPAIVVPGDGLPIECLAEASTTGWNVSLQHHEKVIPLNISSTNYNNDLDRWRLTADIPIPQIYELYDLVVSADGIVTDTTQNAVQIIPEFKEDYYFVHITDTHLPTHIFYPDPLSLTDSTEVEDFREVVKDINLIKPEFVLLTGDLLNEGEMENFENRRVYTKAQRLLSEFEVPVFLTSGNHDIGGWDSSPPPQGTARRNWWKFFGWNWLENPPASEPFYTQNYSFDYGPLHYIGMEAYDNYDGFMSDIYGYLSFTDGQMQWLENDLQQNPASLANVIFYHFDFSDQINLVNLGIDMALWGHIHSNAGDLTSPPYDISTESTCDGNRAYRVVYVEVAYLQPTETIYAGWNGDNLETTFTPENNGYADSVYCFIENSQSLNFPNAQLKFIMPAGAEQYIAYNGDITQIDDSGEFSICYISFEIQANSNLSVSVVANNDTSADDQLLPRIIQLSNYPNPFNPETVISFQLSGLSEVILSIYNIKGQLVRILVNETIQEGEHSVIWDGKDRDQQFVPSGIYNYVLDIGNQKFSNKMILIK